MMRFRLRTLVAVSALATTVLACGDAGPMAPPLGFDHALAASTCGPADGPAVVIVLSNEPVETLSPPTLHLRINLWQAVHTLPGKTLSLDPESMEGGASLAVGSDLQHVATGGSVHISSVGVDNVVTGHLAATFAARPQVRGGFTARWMPSRAFCG